MSEVIVRPVRSWLDRRRFVNLAWSLYRHDPHWVPPLRMNIKQMLGYSRHPFQEVSETQTFLAFRDGQVVGRVAAILYTPYLKQYNERRGFFGFFESIDDQPVATALFDAVKQWFAARDVKALRGPANPSLNYECGLLVDGFDSPPTFMMTYNPPYYARLIENCGFRTGRNLYAYIGYIDQLPEIEARLGPIADQVAEHTRAIVRPMNPARFKEDVAVFLEQYNLAMMQTWSFVPYSQAEMQTMANDLKHFIVPEMTLIAEVDGKPVGAILGLMDFNPRIKAINGRLFPFGFLKLLRSPKGLTKMRVLSINVVPDYQRWGVGLLLMRALVPKALEFGVREAEFSWILEDNMLARKGLEKGGAKIYKTYRIYDYDPPVEV